jgi:hypothetical protein
MLFDTLDAHLTYLLLSFLNGEELREIAVAIPKVRKICSILEFRLFWFENHYNFIRPENMERNLFLQCAKNCVKHIRQQCETKSGDSLKILNADEHRENCKRDDCELCETIDDKDIVRIFIHFFNLFPLVFKSNPSYGTFISHSVSNVFFLYSDSPYGISENPYGFPIFETSWSRNEEKWAPKNIHDYEYLDRLMKIPKWFLNKYYVYLNDCYNHFYQYVLDESVSTNL